MAIDEDRLQQLLEAPEDAHLERKPETANREELRRTLVAFANTVEEGQEATLLIGIDDRGNVTGVQNTDAKQKDIRRICAEDCYPAIDHQSDVGSIGGRNVVVVTVPASGRRPHFAGAAYVRRGSESVAATPDVYEDLIASRNDKCRVLLTWRDQNVTLMEDGFNLEKGRITGEWRARRECRILACNAHTLRIQDTGTQTRYALPLQQVELGYDENKYRNLITVHR